MRSFRRSGAFGLIGVFVVAGAVAAIALEMGSGEAKPKTALALIFGVIGLFMALLFLLQDRDLVRAEAASQPSTTARRAIGHPTTLPEADLWAALATEPITEEALRARHEGYAPVRGSIWLASLLTVLIFVGVVPVYLLDTFVPILVAVPLIGGTALWKSVRLGGQGGELDQGYERVTRAMAPLGLRVVQRPRIKLRIRLDRPLYSPDMTGALVLEGSRHGREVSVCFPTGGVRSQSAVELTGEWPDFEVEHRDGRLRAERGAPAGIGPALSSLPASKRWRGVHVEGGEGGLIVHRESSGEGDWLCDLWLAERIAAALAGR